MLKVVRTDRVGPAGAVEVKAPRVNDKRIDDATGERKRFTSAILPVWCRRSPKMTEVLPLLYLHGPRFKLIMAAQDRWRAVNAPHLVAFVRAGAVFVNRRLIERTDEPAADETSAGAAA